MPAKPRRGDTVVSSPFDTSREDASPALSFLFARKAEAQAVLDRLIAEHGDDGPFQVAAVYAWWGDADRAFAWLDRAIAQHDGGIMDLRLEPLLAKIRKDPRFPAVLARAGLGE